MVSHAFSFFSSQRTVYNNSTVAFCAFLLHHNRFFEHAIPSTTSRKCVWLFSQPSTRTYTENVALDFSLCSSLRSIIYALSEPQMGLEKSRRKNLRPSFQNFFLLSILYSFWLCWYGSENVYLAQISYQTISLLSSVVLLTGKVLREEMFEKLFIHELEISFCS